MLQQTFVLLLLLLCLAAPAPANIAFLVFPPENLTKTKTLSWVGEGLAIAISEECQVPGVDTISWEERVRFLEASDLPPNSTLSRASMIRVAQRVAADRIIYGKYTGTEDRLNIELQVLDLKSLRVSGPIVATGPESALPQIENELAWVILSNNGRNGALSRDSFRARTRTVPNKAYAYFINCLAAADEAERAIMLVQALEMHRDFPQASYLLGTHYFQLNDCTRTVQYLTPALREAQYLLDAQFMLGTCFLKQENPSEAIQAYSAILARVQCLEVLNNLGVAYMRAGDYPLAVQNLIAARALAKTDLTVGLNLALLRQLQGDEAAALAVLEELVKAHPEQGMLQYLYGTVLGSRGQKEQAATALESAGKLGIDLEKMKRQDPRSWSRIFPSWTRRAVVPVVGDGQRKDGEAHAGQRH